MMKAKKVCMTYQIYKFKPITQFSNSIKLPANTNITKQLRSPCKNAPNNTSPLFPTFKRASKSGE